MRFGKLDLVADFDFRVGAVDVLGLGQRNLGGGIGDFVDDRLHREKLDLSVLRVELRPQILGALVVLARRREHGLFHRLDDDVGLDAFFLGERLDGLL